VLDAGTTESGRPFFVMELVKGVPITSYCDERKLTPRQRLELFVPVCQAIQHAHQKGIIHRDIKPSNVLVAVYDDRPVPKVIDFGVAKATGPALTDQTLVTGYGAVVGTPEYMSPEQAGLNRVDVDTRSDVYALGVLLYELLTGTTPIDRKSLGRAALLEVLRMVREVDAPRASAKLSSSDALPRIAANRNTEPAKLSRLLKGELDWILQKALEKDRTRRYETVNGLARDVQSYLADEVVEARPPSAGYRLKKVVRRHKGPVIATGLILLALIAGTVGTTLGLLEARKHEQIARHESEEKETARLEAVLEKVAAEAARRRADEEAAIAKAGLSFFRGGALDGGQIALEADGTFELDADRSVQSFLERVSKQIGTVFRDRPRYEAQIRISMGNLYRNSGNKLAIDHFARAVSLLDRELRRDDPELIEVVNLYAESLAYFGPPAPASAAFVRVRDAQTRTLGPHHPDTLLTSNNLACTYFYSGNTADAFAIWEDVLRADRAQSRPGTRRTLLVMHNYIHALETEQRYEKAIDLRREILAVRTRREPSANLNQDLARLGRTLEMAGQGAEAETVLRRVIASADPQLEGGGEYLRWLIRGSLGSALLSQKKYADAQPLLLAAYEGMKDIPPGIGVVWPGVCDPPIFEVLDRLIELYTAWDKPEEAKKWRAVQAKYPPRIAPLPKK
jgi:non-specific serine/threonine protein kinase/serine/threonine-protein kinase